MSISFLATLSSSSFFFFGDPSSFSRAFLFFPSNCMFLFCSFLQRHFVSVWSIVTGREQFFTNLKVCYFNLLADSELWISKCSQTHFLKVWSKNFLVDRKSSLYCSLSMRQCKKDLEHDPQFLMLLWLSSNSLGNLSSISWEKLYEADLLWWYILASEINFLYWVSSASTCWLVFHFSSINLFSTCWNIFTAVSGFDTIILGCKIASFLAKLHWRDLGDNNGKHYFTLFPEFQILQLTDLLFLQGSA